jgi:hypothetical protein
VLSRKQRAKWVLLTLLAGAGMGGAVGYYVRDSVADNPYRTERALLASNLPAVSDTSSDEWTNHASCVIVALTTEQLVDDEWFAQCLESLSAKNDKMNPGART